MYTAVNFPYHRAVFTSSASTSSLTSRPAYRTRCKSALYKEEGLNARNFLTKDSLSVLKNKRMMLSLPSIIQTYLLLQFLFVFLLLLLAVVTFLTHFSLIDVAGSGWRNSSSLVKICILFFFII